MANQKFIDNQNGLPTIWGQISGLFARKTDVPTKTSGLTNDSGFLTTHQDISGKLDKAGDASEAIAKFTQATTRTNILTGEKFNIIFGKIAKNLSDIKTVAFSGNYADLSGKPTVPSEVSQLSDALDYAKKVDIPKDNSDLTNGAGYQTVAQVNTIVTAKGYQTASQVDTKISTALSSAVEWKGTVQAEANLPATPQKGDMYNIIAKSSYGSAGTNVVWSGTEWDSLSGTFTIEAMTVEEIKSICV